MFERNFNSSRQGYRVVIELKRDAVADVAGSLHAMFGPASKNYFSAKKAVGAKHRLGDLGDRPRRLGHHLRGLVLELRRELSAPFSH